MKVLNLILFDPKTIKNLIWIKAINYIHLNFESIE